jgi:predicted metal-binding membrane protein
MMAAMMVPTVSPWIGAYYRFAIARTDRLRSLYGATLFTSGYFVVWVAFGVVVTVAQHVLTVSDGAGRALLVVAGLFQLSPLKQACLAHCRNPFSVLLARWRNGPVSAVRLGGSHGLYCLGCCWALMLTMLAAGVLGWMWMAALAAITFAEQATEWGRWLTVPVGVGLLAAAAIV